MMRFPFLLLCVIFFGSVELETEGSPMSADIMPENLSYTTLVTASDKLCNGLLIMDTYVLTPASCVNGSSEVRIILGYGKKYTESPYTQVFYSTHIIVHEEFAKFAQNTYLNNIALVKLPRPALINNNVQLITSQEAAPLEGDSVIVGGILTIVNGELDDIGMEMITAQIEKIDTCFYLDEWDVLGNQQLCLTMLTELSYVAMGNAITIDNKLLGLTTTDHQCGGSEDTCILRFLVLNLIPFSKWMSQKMNIPIKQFTSPRSKDTHDHEESKNVHDNINKTLQEKLNTLENKFSDQNQIIQKQLKDIVDKLEYNALKDNESNLKLQIKIEENLNTAQTNNVEEKLLLDEFKKVLDKQKDDQMIILEDIEKQFKTHILQENEAQLKFQEKINDLVNSIQQNTLRLEQFTNEHEQKGIEH